MDAPNSGSLDWTLGEVRTLMSQGTHLTEYYGVYQKHIIGMLLGFDVLYEVVLRGSLCAASLNYLDKHREAQVSSVCSSPFENVK